MLLEAAGKELQKPNTKIGNFGKKEMEEPKGITKKPRNKNRMLTFPGNKTLEKTTGSSPTTCLLLGQARSQLSEKKTVECKNNIYQFPLLETENGEVIKPSDGDEVDYETFNSDYETFKSELETQTTKNPRKKNRSLNFTPGKNNKRVKASNRMLGMPEVFNDIFSVQRLAIERISGYAALMLVTALSYLGVKQPAI